MEDTFMFKLKLLPEDFFNLCIKRKVEIKKLDKLPKLDNNYLLFIAKYQEVEIIPDISLFNYEEALNENRYLECIILKYQGVFGVLDKQDREMDGF